MQTPLKAVTLHPLLRQVAETEQLCLHALFVTVVSSVLWFGERAMARRCQWRAYWLKPTSYHFNLQQILRKNTAQTLNSNNHNH
jgi:hypothetical protein